MKEKDRQSKRWQITINNPADKGLDHIEIGQRLRNTFKTLEYYCLADEIGESGTYHTHLYCCFKSRVRFSSLRRCFDGGAHIEVARSTPSMNRDYVRKSGKWEDTEKAETRVEGSYEEWGEIPPDSKGKRYDMTMMLELVEAGYSDLEIIQKNQDLLIHLDKIQKLRMLVLSERYREEIREMRVIYVCGETGTYKTTSILQEFGMSETYRVTDYDHPFDNYNMQDTVIFEEFRNSLKCSDMLKYLEGFPLELPARYCNRWAMFHTAVVISNWPLTKMYQDLQTKDKKTWDAFLRRINEVRVHTKEGVTVYNSVEEYLNREEFVECTGKEIPFL